MPTSTETWESGASTRYYHTDTGLLERLEDYAPDGSLTLSVVYRYNDQDQNIERIVLDSKGKKMRRLVFEFDSNGKETIHHEYDANDRLLFTRSARDDSLNV